MISPLRRRQALLHSAHPSWRVSDPSSAHAAVDARATLCAGRCRQASKQWHQCHRWCSRRSVGGVQGRGAHQCHDLLLADVPLLVSALQLRALHDCHPAPAALCGSGAVHADTEQHRWHAPPLPPCSSSSLCVRSSRPRHRPAQKATGADVRHAVERPPLSGSVPAGCQQLHGAVLQPALCTLARSLAMPRVVRQLVPMGTSTPVASQLQGSC